MNNETGLYVMTKRGRKKIKFFDKSCMMIAICLAAAQLFLAVALNT